MFGMEANHLGFFDDQGGGRSDGGRRSDLSRLAGEASLAKEIPRSQNGHDRLFAGFVDDGELYSACLNVEGIPARIALREDRFFFLKFRDLPSHTRRIEELLGVE